MERHAEKERSNAANEIQAATTTPEDRQTQSGFPFF